MNPDLQAYDALIEYGEALRARCRKLGLDDTADGITESLQDLAWARSVLTKLEPRKEPNDPRTN